MNCDDYKKVIRQPNVLQTTNILIIAWKSLLEIVRFPAVLTNVVNSLILTNYVVPSVLP